MHESPRDEPRRDLAVVTSPMHIHVLGGGPAGLYFSLLARKRLPGSRITVFERNRPDDTYGWGVVFSDETLEDLRRGRSRDPPGRHLLKGRVAW